MGMLKQGSVSDIRTGKLTRSDGYIVIAMCFYPRGLKKILRDEYIRALAPDQKLFKDWQQAKAHFGHDLAFARSRYQNRYILSAIAVEHLRRLSARSKRENVYVICQCSVGDRCHREILLLLASKEF
jgi:uncharacterized protein YeaO (DUF488 family)